jgi:hypothetical protein
MQLQYKWDVFMLTRFYRKPDQRMGFIVTEFKQRYMCDDDALTALLRVPKSPTMLRRPVTAFIGIHLKKIADICWKSSVDDVFDIAEKLKSSTLDAVEKRLVVDKEIIETRKDYRRGMMEYAAYIDHKEKTNRSNWSACKP